MEMSEADDRPLEETDQRLPSVAEFAPVVLQVLEALGGEGTNQEIEELIVQAMDLSPAQQSRRHKPERESRTELDYRIAWAKTKLRIAGRIENVGRGIWAIIGRS